MDEVEIPTTEIVNLEEINEKYQYLQELYLENFQSDSWQNFRELKEDILSELAKYKNIPTAIMKKIQDHFMEKKHGTYFIIFDPINEIVDLEKEQESNLKEEQEDTSEQTRYVRSALSGLFNPFDEKLLEERKSILGEDFSKTPSFIIYTSDGNEHDFLQLKDFFSEEEFASCEHWIDGVFDSEQRKEQKELNKKKREREDLIKQEKKRNYQAVVQIRKQIIDNRKVMVQKKNEILILKIEIDSIIQKKKNLNEEAREVFSKLDSLKKDINILKINVSPDITLTGNDSINDLLHDYEDERNELEKILADCDKKANEHVYVNILKNEYGNKYVQIKKEIERMFDTIEKSISENFKEITMQLNKKILESKRIIYRLSPVEVEIDVLSEEETIKRMEELDTVLNSIRQEYENIYFPFVRQFENITLEKDFTKTLEAYKSKEIELTKQIDSFYELAQIGMSIEVIDHQFNVLYAQIASALSKLGTIAKKSSEISEIYNPLKMSFQHLESNHKMLMPMYRTTRRNKTNISGKDIVKAIANFYGNVLEKDGIEFGYSEVFANYTFYSFESIIIPVFLNVINNAIYWVAYGKERKRIEIKVKGKEILIMNSGAKMSYTELTRCFEIFYTKKTSGRGIGLYLAKKCLNSIDFDIYATNDKEYNVLDGACFVICQHEGE